MNCSFLGIFLDWRWLAICSSIPPTLLMVCMCFMPETPRYLLSKGKRREAEEALRFLRGPDAPIEWECARIEDAYDEQVSLWLVRSNEQRRICWKENPGWLCRRTLAAVQDFEMSLILSSYCQSSSFQMSDLKDPGVYKPLVIGFMLMFFQQMTGINAIMFYAQNIFEQANFKVRGLNIFEFLDEIWHPQCTVLFVMSVPAEHVIMSFRW